MSSTIYVSLTVLYLTRAFISLNDNHIIASDSTFYSPQLFTHLCNIHIDLGFILLLFPTAYGHPYRTHSCTTSIWIEFWLIVYIDSSIITACKRYKHWWYMAPLAVGNNIDLFFRFTLYTVLKSLKAPCNTYNYRLYHSIHYTVKISSIPSHNEPNIRIENNYLIILPITFCNPSLCFNVIFELTRIDRLFCLYVQKDFLSIY